MKKRVRRILQYVKLLMVWKWPARWSCHASLFPCQYTDHPMDNPS